MGAFVKGELHLVIDAIVSYIIHWILLLTSFFDILILFFKERVEGHCLGLVTRNDSVIHTHFMDMKMLARDESPFLLAILPRYITLVW
jgi:hypothetical protein